MKRICRYLQGIKYKGLVFNIYEVTVVGFYVDTYFVGLLEHDNPQYPIFLNSRTGFLTLPYFPILLASMIKTWINIFTLHS